MNNNKKEFLPLEEGKYAAKLESFVEKSTKKGDGSYIEAQFIITDEKYAKRRLWHRFMTSHPSSNVKKIGLEQLNSFIKSMGGSDSLESVGDLENYVGNNLVLKVGVKEDPKFGVQNRITSFWKAS